jgi:subtilisin family serine protease
MMTRLSQRLVVAGVLAAMAGGLFGAGPAASYVPEQESAPRVGEILYADSPDAVADTYIAVLAGNLPPSDTTRMAQELTAKYGGNLGYVYSAGLRGFSVRMSADKAALLAGEPGIKYVAQDQVMTLDALVVQPSPPSWGIDRIDQRSLPLDAKYHYPNTASSVRAFIIDSGMRLTHQEFGGRAFCGFDPWAMGCDPCGQGHATHVAGTVGGSTVGVAKGVRIVSVRVFECSPSTTSELVIAGVEYVTFAASLTPPGMRNVANMSLSGGIFQPLDDAVVASIDAGVHYSVSAGNNNGASACTRSPARVPRATTVAATAINDVRPAFSNIGPCVDLFAPGVAITSAWYTADNAYASAQGTSMSAPHATGTAALWRHRFPADSADATHNALNANATPGVVINPGLGSPNLLLFMAMIPV